MPNQSSIYPERIKSYPGAWKKLCSTLSINPNSVEINSRKQQFYHFYSVLPWSVREEVIDNLTNSKVGRRTLFKRQLKDYIQNPAADKIGRFLFYGLVSYQESLTYTNKDIMELMLTGLEKTTDSQDKSLRSQEVQSRLRV